MEMDIEYMEVDVTDESIAEEHIDPVVLAVQQQQQQQNGISNLTEDIGLKNAIVGTNNTHSDQKNRAEPVQELGQQNENSSTETEEERSEDEDAALNTVESNNLSNRNMTESGDSSGSLLEVRQEKSSEGEKSEDLSLNTVVGNTVSKVFQDGFESTGKPKQRVFEMSEEVSNGTASENSESEMLPPVSKDLNVTLPIVIDKPKSKNRSMVEVERKEIKNNQDQRIAEKEGHKDNNQKSESVDTNSINESVGSNENHSPQTADETFFSTYGDGGDEDLGLDIGNHLSQNIPSAAGDESLFSASCYVVFSKGNKQQQDSSSFGLAAVRADLHSSGSSKQNKDGNTVNNVCNGTASESERLPPVSKDLNILNDAFSRVQDESDSISEYMIGDQLLQNTSSTTDPCNLSSADLHSSGSSKQKEDGNTVNNVCNGTASESERLPPVSKDLNILNDAFSRVQDESDSISGHMIGDQLLQNTSTTDPCNLSSADLHSSGSSKQNKDGNTVNNVCNRTASESERLPPVSKDLNDTFSEVQDESDSISGHMIGDQLLQNTSSTTDPCNLSSADLHSSGSSKQNKDGNTVNNVCNGTASESERLPPVSKDLNILNDAFSGVKDEPDSIGGHLIGDLFFHNTSATTDTFNVSSADLHSSGSSKQKEDGNTVNNVCNGTASESERLPPVSKDLNILNDDFSGVQDEPDSIGGHMIVDHFSHNTSATTDSFNVSSADLHSSGSSKQNKDTDSSTPEPLKRRKKKHPEPLPMKMVKKSNKEPLKELSTSSSDEDESANIPLKDRQKAKQKTVRIYRKETKADREVLNEMENPKPSTSAAIRKEWERNRLSSENLSRAKDTTNMDFNLRRTREIPVINDSKKPVQNTGVEDAKIPFKNAPAVEEAGNVNETVVAKGDAERMTENAVLENENKFEENTKSPTENITIDNTGELSKSTFLEGRMTRSMRTQNNVTSELTNQTKISAADTPKTSQNSSTKPRGRERVKKALDVKKPDVKVVSAPKNKKNSKASEQEEELQETLLVVPKKPKSRGKSKASRPITIQQEEVTTNQKTNLTISSVHLEETKASQKKMVKTKVESAEIPSGSKGKKTARADVPNEVAVAPVKATSRGKSKARPVISQPEEEVTVKKFTEKTKSVQFKEPSTNQKINVKSNVQPPVVVASGSKTKKTDKTIVSADTPKASVKANPRGKSKARPIIVQEEKTVTNKKKEEKPNAEPVTVVDSVASEGKKNTKTVQAEKSAIRKTKGSKLVIEPDVHTGSVKSKGKKKAKTVASTTQPPVEKGGSRSKSKARPAPAAAKPEPVVVAAVEKRKVVIGNNGSVSTDATQSGSGTLKPLANGTGTSKTTTGKARNNPKNSRPHEPEVSQVNEETAQDDGVRRSKRPKKLRHGDEWIY